MPATGVRKAGSGGSKGEEALAFALRAIGKYHVEREYRWHPTRRFRSDFAIWRSAAENDAGTLPLLVEIDGAKRGKPGAHQTVDGVDYDCRRSAEALVRGYVMLRVSTRMVKDGTALNHIESLMDPPA